MLPNGNLLELLALSQYAEFAKSMELVILVKNKFNVNLTKIT